MTRSLPRPTISTIWLLFGACRVRVRARSRAAGREQSTGRRARDTEDRRAEDRCHRCPARPRRHRHPGRTEGSLTGSCKQESRDPGTRAGHATARPTPDGAVAEGRAAEGRAAEGRAAEGRSEPGRAARVGPARVAGRDVADDRSRRGRSRREQRALRDPAERRSRIDRPRPGRRVAHGHASPCRSRRPVRRSRGSPFGRDPGATFPCSNPASLSR